MATKKTASKSAKAPTSSAGRVSVPGLKDSKGMQGFLILPDGTFSFECVSCKIKESANSPADLWNFQFKVLDGEFEGKRWGWRVTILRPEHPKFETVKMGVDELKSMCLAFGVVPKGDDISPESFQGLKGAARVGQKMGTDAQGNERPENRVYEWLALE